MLGKGAINGPVSLPLPLPLLLLLLLPLPLRHASWEPSITQHSAHANDFQSVHRWLGLLRRSPGPLPPAVLAGRPWCHCCCCCCCCCVGVLGGGSPRRLSNLKWVNVVWLCGPERVMPPVDFKKYPIEYYSVPYFVIACCHVENTPCPTSNFGNVRVATSLLVVETHCVSSDSVECGEWWGCCGPLLGYGIVLRIPTERAWWRWTIECTLSVIGRLLLWPGTGGGVGVGCMVEGAVRPIQARHSSDRSRLAGCSVRGWLQWRAASHNSVVSAESSRYQMAERCRFLSIPPPPLQ